MSYAGFLKYVFPFAWHTCMQSSWMACLISSSVSQTMGIHVLVFSNRLTLTIFILDWDAVLSVGDDVAVPV